MTPENKEATRQRIDSLRTKGVTNLWHGLLRGLEAFGPNPRRGSVATMMVLSDGQPNYM